MNNYKKENWKIQYFFESARLWDYIFSNIKHLKPLLIVFKGENFEDYAKLEYQKKHVDKILTWTKNNVKYKSYIYYICLGHI